MAKEEKNQGEDQSTSKEPKKRDRLKPPVDPESHLRLITEEYKPPKEKKFLRVEDKDDKGDKGEKE